MDEKQAVTPVTKDRLLKYLPLKREYENQLERLARMRNDAEIPAMREGDGSKHSSGSSDRMVTAVINRMAYEEKIAPKVKENLREMRALEMAVASLEDPLEREVLRLRYMDSFGWRPMPWGEVALKIYGDNDEKQRIAVYRLHGRALQSISKILI